MRQVRVSTTVDRALLGTARRVREGVNDASLLDEVLEALLRLHRRVEIEEAYRAYDHYPPDEPDEWGDLASFRRAVGKS